MVIDVGASFPSMIWLLKSKPLIQYKKLKKKKTPHQTSAPERVSKLSGYKEKA